MQPEQTTIENTPKKSKKPKWLKRLEEESWQAELIISGLAIFGSLQLPAYIKASAEWALTFFQLDSHLFMYFFFWFLILGAMSLITSFLIHFVMRAVWVGMVGFNSIYPNGIKKEGKYFSKFYLEKALEEYPNKTYDLKKLDDLCSGVFATAAVLSMSMVSISLLIILILGFKYLLELMLPAEIAEIILYVLIGFILLLWLAMTILNLKRFHDNEKLQHLYYKIAKGYQFLSMNFFRDIANYISLSVFSNEGLKMKSPFIPLLLVLLMGASMYQLINSKVILFFRPELGCTNKHKKYVDFLNPINQAS